MSSTKTTFESYLNYWGMSSSTNDCKGDKAYGTLSVSANNCGVHDRIIKEKNDATIRNPHGHR